MERVYRSRFEFRQKAYSIPGTWRKDDLAMLKKHVIRISKLFSKETELPPDGLVKHSKVGPILIDKI